VTQLPPAYPLGPDYTRELHTADPDPLMDDIMRATAFGRARGLMDAAYACTDAAERDARINALILRLVDFALSGADLRTILDGLR
jgi:hypothetical protein